MNPVDPIRATIVCLLFFLLPHPTHAEEPYPPPEVRADQAGALLSARQVELDALAARLLRTPTMQEQLRYVEALYASDAQGKTPVGKATIGRAAQSIATAAIHYAIGEATRDEGRPFALWTCKAPYRLDALEAARSGYGIENPDNVYRNFMIDGNSRYEIHGKVTPPGPAEQHFELRDGIPGMNALQPEGGQLLAGLRSDRMQIAGDGTFTITVDGEPANGRPNHIQLPSRENFMLIVRDLFTDWSVQNPIALEIEQLSPPVSARPHTEESIAARAAEILAKIARFWVDWDNSFVYSAPANALRAPRIRGVGRGMSSGGHFAIADDEALVLTLDALGARSMGVQLTDPWGVAYEYVHRSSSLNNAQAEANADGTYTFVIAVRDPGVNNWLDPQGYGAGMMAVRWQSLPGDPAPQRGIRDVRRVKLGELAGNLPQETHYLSAEERAQQRLGRIAHYSRRLTE